MSYIRNILFAQILLVLAISMLPLASAKSPMAELQLEEASNDTLVGDTNETLPPVDNETEVIEEPVEDFMVTGFIPRDFELGDVQFNIQVKNIGNVELNNILAVVSGDGYSTYNLVPIDSLTPGDKSYIIMMGSFKKAGSIMLTIKINDKIFYQDVVVTDPNAAKNEQEEKDKQAELERKAAISMLTAKLDELNSNYTSMEREFEIKKKDKYDVSGISLTDMKSYLRSAQSSLVMGDIEKANASLTIALNEYKDQRDKLDNAQLIEKSFIDVIRNNLLFISTMAGSLITLITLYEILKKKKDRIQTRIQENRSSISKLKKDQKKLEKQAEKTKAECRKRHGKKAKKKR